MFPAGTPDVGTDSHVTPGPQDSGDRAAINRETSVTNVKPWRPHALPPTQTMNEGDVMKAKLCLAGASSVGKTSLIRRFALNEFDDHYITTIGTKVSKKQVSVPVKDEDPVMVNLMVWDIMGQMGFRELLQEQYFTGAQGVLAVADVTRPETLDDLYIWIDQIDRIAGSVPIVLAVNKVDLPRAKHIPESSIRKFVHAFDCEVVRTSAKTGANVEEVFWRLSRFMINRALAHS